LRDARIHWRDEALEAPLETTLSASATLDPVTLGAGAPEASFELTLALSEVFDRLQVQAALQLDPEDTRAELDLSLDGLRAGPLAAYLPANTRLDLDAGRMAGRVDLSSAVSEAGGRGARLELSAFDFRDAQADEPLLALERLTLDVARFDLDAGVIDIAELS
jgi:hypothetical protein